MKKSKYYQRDIIEKRLKFLSDNGFKLIGYNNTFERNDFKITFDLVRQASANGWKVLKLDIKNGNTDVTYQKKRHKVIRVKE